MQKSFTQILFVVLFLIAAILFLPLPYYESGNIVCKPGQTNCGQKGWNLREPLWKKIYTRFQNRSDSVPASFQDSTANWKTYKGETGYTTDGSTMFSIKYPNNWDLDKNVLYPYGKNSDPWTNTVVVLGAGGRGWSGKIETRNFPAGNAQYSWIDRDQSISAFASFIKDNNSYIFEVENLPSNKGPEFKEIFDQILSTFKFTK